MKEREKGLKKEEILDIEMNETSKRNKEVKKKV